MKRPYKRKTIMERFLRSFSKTEGDSCWLWLKRLDRDGYGQMTFHLDNDIIMVKKAHRVAYEILVGEIPTGMCICHKCDNPSCVNPSHLFLGSQADNIRDMVNKKRQMYGKQHWNVKLKPEDILEIKNLVASGLTNTEVAKKFNIAQQTVSAIKNNKSWIHLEVSNG